jgi:hypothetical protein
LIPLLRGLVDDAGLFPPTSLSMAETLDRHRQADSPMLSGRLLVPHDRIGELLGLMGEDEKLDVHVIGGQPTVEDPRLTVRAVELSQALPSEIPCYVEGIAPQELAGRDYFGKVRCGGATILSVEELALYLRWAARLSLPFKATAGLHAAVRGWESTDGQPHHGYLNLLLATARALSADDVEGALASTDATVLVDGILNLSGDLVTATRWLLHSYGSCDTTRPVNDARDLGLL